jgi:hypothetical protein
MSKARDLANAGTALTTVSATELGYLDGVTSAVQTQVDAKIAKSTVTAKGDLLVATGSGTVVAQPVGTNGQYLQADSTQADGVKWADVTTLPSQTGNSGKYLTTDGTTASWGTVSVPIKWTNRLSPASTYRFNEIAYNGSNLYVAVGNNGTLYSSSDGITWTSRTSGFGTTAIFTVAYGNGLFVAAGNSGILTTSTDGITWTARTSNMGSNQIQQVVYANSVWVGVGYGGGTTNTGGIIYSTDGITWTRKSQSLTVGSQYYGVAWNGTYWIVAANQSTNNFLYASTPSGTWTAGLVNGSGANYWVGCDGGNTFLFNSSSSVFIGSNSATLASVSQVSGTFAYANQTMDRTIATIYNGRLYFSNGAYLYNFATSTITTHPDISQVTLNPDVTSSTSTPYIGLTGGCIWVGATGQIIGGNQGRIWTSF